jgi:hypothetical protein
MTQTSRPQPVAAGKGHAIALSADVPARQGVMPDTEFLFTAIRAASLGDG